jgi:hypothetical protein
MQEQGEPPSYSRDAWTSKKYQLGLDFPNVCIHARSFGLCGLLTVICCFVSHRFAAAVLD